MEAMRHFERNFVQLSIFSILSNFFLTFYVQRQEKFLQHFSINRKREQQCYQFFLSAEINSIEIYIYFVRVQLKESKNEKFFYFYVEHNKTGSFITIFISSPVFCVLTHTVNTGQFSTWFIRHKLLSEAIKKDLVFFSLKSNLCIAWNQSFVHHFKLTLDFYY